MKLSLIVALSATLIAPLASAAERNDIPSCYDYAGLATKKASTLGSRSLTVAIDGTFSPDVNLKRSVHEKVHTFLKPGDKITVVGFSAYVGDNYTDIKFTGQLDAAITEREDIGKKALRKFDTCIGKQRAFVRKKIDDAIKLSFKPDEVSVPKTELINNISEFIAPIVAIGAAKEKTLLLVSDMLENSDITSFYKAGGVREMNADRELAKVSDAQMLTDFSGASVYIIGAGWLPEGKRGFRGGKAMRQIKSFWSGYFAKSNAELVGFGQPALLMEL